MTDRPELQKDANGLWPGQRTSSDIPDFLDRRVVITDVNSGPSLYEVIAASAGLPRPENAPPWVSHVDNLQETAPNLVLPWAAKT